MILAWATASTRLGDSVAMMADTARSTTSIVASGTERVMLATLRATHASASSASTTLPDQRQAVLQVEHVGDRRLAGERVHLADHGDLGDAELAHPR